MYVRVPVKVGAVTVPWNTHSPCGAIDALHVAVPVTDFDTTDRDTTKWMTFGYRW